MAKQEVKLLGSWMSPFVYRVVWALKLKGVEYEYVEEDLNNKSPSLLQYNPIYHKVPVLVHGGNPLVESFVILEYIDETWKGNQLLPEDPHERAMIRFWAKFAEEKCLNEVWRVCCSDGEERQKAIESTVEALKTLDGLLKGKKFFAGQTIGFLDIVVGWTAYWLGVFEEVKNVKVMDAQTFPSLKSWMDNFVEVPVIKENQPPCDKMVTIFRRA